MFSPLDDDVVTTLTPLLETNNSFDADGQQLSYNFELYDQSGSTLLASADSLAESSPRTSWQVPSGLLEDGLLYQWRVRAFDGVSYSAWSSLVSFSALSFATGTSAAEPNPHFYPNPFNVSEHSEVIFTEIPQGANLLLTTLTGREVKRWADVTGGEVTWYGNNMSGNPVSSQVLLWFIEKTDYRGKLLFIR
jgi:hypothetical protein